MITRINSKNITDDIANARQDINEMKSAQPIKGDSWVPYRYTGSVTIPDSGIRYIVFTQDDTSRPAVVRIDQSLDQTPYAVGWRVQNGVHCFPAYDFTDGNSKTQNYVIYSTMTGSVTTSSSPPF